MKIVTTIIFCTLIFIRTLLFPSDYCNYNNNYTYEQTETMTEIEIVEIKSIENNNIHNTEEPDIKISCNDYLNKSSVNNVAEIKIVKIDFDTADLNPNHNLNKDVNQKYLLQIDNPDTTYTTYPMTLSDYDREQLAHLVMGEFGTGGFTGCALIAQSVRDAMVKFGYASIDEVIEKMQYSGWYYGEPSDFAYEAIDYIFTQGNAAVQHEILVMYASNIIYSGWHEAQEFVIEYEFVRFFDF